MTTGPFESFTFRCGLEVKNRMVLAPLTNTQSPTTFLSDEEFAWLGARIRGGFGIVTSCATHVMKTAQAWDGELGIYSDDHISGWRKLAVAAESEKALVIPQLFHGGFRCPSRVTGAQPASASAFEIDAPDFEKPRALLEDEIVSIKEHFVQAARRAISAGLPGVEIHGANGYLFTQFLSTFTNRRTDRWGGSLENRARFLLEVVAEIRRAIGRDRVLGVRLSPENTKLIPGIDIDEMKEVATELSRLDVDYLSLSLWDARKVSDKYGSNHEAPTVIEQFRSAVPQATAIMVSGKIWTPDDAQEVLSLGADLVALGACGIANPSWPNLAMRGQADMIRRLPMTLAELRDRAVSDRFATYLERWGFITRG